MDRRVFFLGLTGAVGVAVVTKLAISDAQALPFAKELKLPRPAPAGSDTVDIASDIRAGEAPDGTDIEGAQYRRRSLPRGRAYARPRRRYYTRQPTRIRRRRNPVRRPLRPF